MEEMRAMIGALSALASAQSAAQLRQALSASAPLQGHQHVAEARRAARQRLEAIATAAMAAAGAPVRAPPARAPAPPSSPSSSSAAAWASSSSAAAAAPYPAAFECPISCVLMEEPARTHAQDGALHPCCG